MTDTMNDKILHQLMLQRLDDDSLRTLCEYIKVDVPSATDLDSTRQAGESLSAKAMSLIRYCRQRRIVIQLVKNLQMVRPDMLGSDYNAWLFWAETHDNPQSSLSQPTTNRIRLLPPSQPSSGSLRRPGHLPPRNPPPKPLDQREINTMPEVSSSNDNSSEMALAARGTLNDDPNERYSSNLVDERYIELEVAIVDKEWDKVISIAQNILADNLTDQSTRDKLKLAYNGRGFAYKERKQYASAIVEYSRAILIDPNYAASYMNRGLTYYSLGQYEQAIADYDQAIRIDPKDTQLYANRAEAYLELDQFERAIADYNQAILLNANDPWLYYERGNTYTFIGNKRKAAADFSRVFRLRSDSRLRGMAERALRDLDVDRTMANTEEM